MKNKFILLALLCWQCTMEENKKPEEYNGPMRELNGMLMHYAENNKVKVKITAAVVKEYLGGDREFPDGIHIEFYDDTGLKSSDLRANNAYYFKKENQWRGRGKVIIQNVAKGEELTTRKFSPKNLSPSSSPTKCFTAPASMPPKICRNTTFTISPANLT